MKSNRQYIHYIFGLVCASIALTGCATTGSINKAPILQIYTKGNLRERKQEYTLKRIKYKHVGRFGKVMGRQFFTDLKLPIAGARKKDTLNVYTGQYKGSYTVKKVIRLRIAKKNKNGQTVVLRKVIIQINEDFNPSWKTIETGSAGRALSLKAKNDGPPPPKNTLFTDTAKYLPEVDKGTQLTLGTAEPQTYVVLDTTTVELKGLRRRVAYILDRPLPEGLKNVSYKVQTPVKAGSAKLSYDIKWRGSSLTGHFFTLGINRRRYSQKEMEDLLKSNKKSQQDLRGTGGKQGAALVLRYTGVLAVVVGGFLALVRRDDFQGAQQAIPWGIVGGGVALIGASVPITVSANNDFLRSAQSYNTDILKRLDVKDPDRKKRAALTPKSKRHPLPKSTSSTIYSSK